MAGCCGPGSAAGSRAGSVATGRAQAHRLQAMAGDNESLGVSGPPQPVAQTTVRQLYDSMAFGANEVVVMAGAT